MEQGRSFHGSASTRQASFPSGILEDFDPTLDGDQRRGEPDHEVRPVGSQPEHEGSSDKDDLSIQRGDILNLVFSATRAAPWLRANCLYSCVGVRWAGDGRL